MPSLPLSRRARGTALAVAALAAAALAPAAQAHARGGSLFVQTDDVAGNTVVAYDRGADGKLHDAGAYPTGGRGGKLDGAVVDNLASQGSLAYDRARGLLYAVNAGSDTLTVFDVRGDRLRRRQVLTSGGRFPVSVTLHDHRLYVLNARDGGSIQGYVATRLGLIRVPGWHRALGLDPTATPEFTHTPGQVAFTPDGGRLLVTTKANTDAIDVFRFDRAGAPVLAADNRRPGTVPFAVDFDAGGHALVTEAGPNAVSSYALEAGGALRALTTVPTGQAATCWIVRTGTHVYASNAGSGTVSRFESSRDGSLVARGTTPTDGGTVDASASPDGRFLYVQAGLEGKVDAFRIAADGSLTAIGTITVPRAAGGEGIAAA